MATEPRREVQISLLPNREKLCLGGNKARIMDLESPSKEVSAELAREMLISISNSLPENAPNQDDASLPSDGQDDPPVANGESNDKYRSELISISYTQSPDFASSPPVGSGCPKP